MNINLRLASKTDQAAIIRLIGEVFREYGERICLENVDSDLLDIETEYFENGGSFWVLESDGVPDDGNKGQSGLESQIVGTHAVLPISKTECTFRRLYLEKSLRGGGYGQVLMKTTIDWAKEKGFERVTFWSDTRFTRAHRFFEKLGFRKTGEGREMLDGFDPYNEFEFELGLGSK